MSVVERAIKKLQDAGATQSEAARLNTKSADPVIGSLVSTPAHPQADLARVPPAAARSGKSIVVDRNALRSAGLMPPEENQRRFANEYRQIKRPLLGAALGKGMARRPNAQSIMLASALPGEGKTFTTLNLAISMALERDVSVVLIDADVAKPHISRTLGVEKEPGLLDVLQDKSLNVESLIIPTDIAGLSILPAGRNLETATELLGSERMRQMVAAIMAHSSNRIALFDSPPLLLTSESRALAGVVGQIVIVVRAALTLRKAVQEAIASLGELSATQSIGLILNQSEAAPPGEYYGYGDYYGDDAARPAVPPT